MVRESTELIRCSSVDFFRREVPGKKIACSIDTGKSSFVGDNCWRYDGIRIEIERRFDHTTVENKKSTQCIQEITNTQDTVVSRIHRHFVEHLFKEKIFKTVVTASRPRGARIAVITPRCNG